MSKSKRVKNSISTAKRIVQAAEALILESGTTGFSMKKLADRADVSLATPYNHFNSKVKILREILKDNLKQIENCYELQKPDEPIKRVIWMAYVGVRFQTDNSRLMRPVVLDVYGVASGESLDQIQSSIAKIWAVAIGNNFPADLQSQGLTPDKLGDQLGHLFRGVTILWALGDFENNKYMEQVMRGIELMLRGVCAPALYEEIHQAITYFLNSKNLPLTVAKRQSLQFEGQQLFILRNITL